MQNIITLDMNTPSVQYLCRKDKRMAKVISMVGAISYTPHNNPYSFLVHEIIEQMLSVKAGQKIYARLEALCDGDISPNRVAKLSDDEIRSIGTSKPKVTYICSITDAIICKELVFEELAEMSDAEVMMALTKIRGVGSWTAKMYLIFRIESPRCSAMGRWSFFTELSLDVQNRCYQPEVCRAEMPKMETVFVHRRTVSV